MKIEVETHDFAHAADKVMHAAQYLAGVSKHNYSDPAVWESKDEAIVLLRTQYDYLTCILDYLWYKHYEDKE